MPNPKTVAEGGDEGDPVKTPETPEVSSGEGVDTDEAKLTYKARKGLPDSAFALVYTDKKTDKKVRRFPIHDAAHARNALARLPQAKGLSPAQKAQVKAKASRALKKFGGKPSETELAIWEITKEEWEEDDDDDDNPVSIDIDSESYPVLFDVIDGLEEEIDELLGKLEELTATLDAVKATLGQKETEAEALKASTDATIAQLTAEKEELEERIKELAEKAPADQHLLAKLKTEVADKDKEITGLQAQVASLASDTDSREAEYKNALARAVASMKIQAKRPEVEGKDLDVVVEELKGRSLSYLTGTFEDLWAASVPTDVSTTDVETVDPPQPSQDPVEPKVDATGPSPRLANALKRGGRHYRGV